MGYMIGNYEVIDKLGSGAMGDVFKGRDPKKNSFVAIKILSEDLSSNPRAVERFKREIRQTIQLDHPNIISAYTAGEFKGRLYYVMEYIEGTTVKKEILARGLYEDRRVLEIMLKLSDALRYAAKFQIIHRDIKPDNIMLTVDGNPKLCDMGLAKSTESDNKLTVMGTVLGTPHYMSPEQAQGEEDLDERSDIFSLGATMYHMLTGAPPFDGPDPISIMSLLLESEPVAIKDRNPKVSEVTCSIIIKMMTKKRNQRYKNFEELHKAISEALKKPIVKPETKARFKDCYVPSEGDVLIGQIAIHNKVINQNQIEECLNKQEKLFLVGIAIDLADVMTDQKLLSPQQKTLLYKARLQFLLDRGDDFFVKVCTNHNLLSAADLEEGRNLQKSGTKGLAALYMEQGKIDDGKREKIYANIRHMMTGEEGKAVLKAALENKVLPQPQVEKCSRIYGNGIVMGKYRSLESILTEKEFLHLKDFRAVVRGVRRSLLTGHPISKYISETRI